jgi:hypothetical protein
VYFTFLEICCSLNSQAFLSLNQCRQIETEGKKYEVEYIEELDQIIKWKGEIECYIHIVSLLLTGRISTIKLTEIPSLYH